MLTLKEELMALSKKELEIMLEATLETSLTSKMDLTSPFKSNTISLTKIIDNLTFLPNIKKIFY